MTDARKRLIAAAEEAPAIINVRIEKGKAGLYHGVSDDMPSLLVSGRSVREVRAAAALIVKAVFEARGEPVPRVKVDEPPSPPPSDVNG